MREKYNVDVWVYFFGFVDKRNRANVAQNHFRDDDVNGIGFNV
jgi:hypothetical protein